MYYLKTKENIKIWKKIKKENQTKFQYFFIQMRKKNGNCKENAKNISCTH